MTGIERIDRLKSLLAEFEVDALLLSSMTDLRWACGFTGSNGVLVLTRSDTHFISDGRYETQSQEEVKNATVHITQGNLLDVVKEEDLFNNAERILVQSDHLTIDVFDRLKNLFEEKDFCAVPDLLARDVSIKTEGEVLKIREAQTATDRVFSHLLELIKPGVSEKEIAAEIVYQHLLLGASAMSFDPIVASGPNSALPHARPTSRTFQLGDLVLIDMGCFMDGYASDMTRTVALGDPGDKAREVYTTVLEAQERAIAMASPSLTTKELDTVARSVIEAAGYGEYFVHSLGHGVGLEIHEWPRVSWRSDDPLATGMVITIEPGIYLPDEFGVRIEDMIHLTDQGCDIFTASPKSLIVL